MTSRHSSTCLLDFRHPRPRTIALHPGRLNSRQAMPEPDAFRTGDINAAAPFAAAAAALICI
jgi:hypothetical protein